MAIMQFRDFKVTTFSTSQKPVCNFSCVNNTKLHTLAPLQRYRGPLVQLTLPLRGLPVFNACMLGEPLNLV